MIKRHRNIPNSRCYLAVYWVISLAFVLALLAFGLRGVF